MARSADLCTRFSGQTVDMQSMRATASRLIAALFYIELCSAPQFHVGNEHASVRVRCRLPPGKQLLLLLKHLNRKATNVHYRGDETRFLSEPLVDSRSLHECRDGRQFSKHLRMRVNTFQSFLHIKIDGIAGGEETISNCPYELQKIITDQGLHLHFGSKDHKLTNEPLEISPNRWDETARLHDTLDEVVLSYSQLAMVPHDSSVVRPLNSLI